MQIAIFQNIRAVICAEKACQAQGIHVIVMPVPEHLSSECGMCLSLSDDDFEFEKLMTLIGLSVRIYDKI